MNLFVARQPIFNARNEVAGYELLYRRSADASHADPADPNQMSSDVIVQSFLEAGLERLTGGLRGFVNFTREMLVRGVYELFDPETIVIELVEDIVADAEVVEACRRLNAAGYTLALDDFIIGGVQEVLLPMAKIVKMDLLNRSDDDIRRIAAHLRPFALTMLAERVETADVVRLAQGEGFSLFQGYYFSRPETIAHKGNAIEALRLLPLMNMVQDERTPFREIERAFRTDPNLAHKLLQIANSATNGTRGVQSIRHAIHLVGRGILYRWMSLLLTSSLASSGVHSPERMEATLLRARFLELMGERTRANTGSLFLVGLFSNMDALLQVPMAELLTRITLVEDVHGALLRRATSPFLRWLELSEAYEAGRWDVVSQLAADVRVPPEKIPGIYVQALQWATDTLDVVTQKAA